MILVSFNGTEAVHNLSPLLSFSYSFCANPEVEEWALYSKLKFLTNDVFNWLPLPREAAQSGQKMALYCYYYYGRTRTDSPNLTCTLLLSAKVRVNLELLICRPNIKYLIIWLVCACVEITTMKRELFFSCSYYIKLNSNVRFISRKKSRMLVGLFLDNTQPYLYPCFFLSCEFYNGQSS